MFARRRMDRCIARRTARRVFHRMSLADQDVAKIEKETGQPAESLTQEQLVAAVK
jgi:hypothetical protein